ncbi:MAG: alpha-galactosidase, partial [Hyphomonadaceae bacterium]|nr:alpha-galactosidase [Hyphomonadaceae bacterium]
MKTQRFNISPSVPAAILASAQTTMDDGPAFGAQLAWSGNHFQRIEPVGNGGYQWQWGEWLAPGEVMLETGQTLSTPAVLATISHNGLNGVAQNFHAHARQIVTWPGGAMKPRPVHFNTWEGVYFKLEESALMEMATGAVALGIERFVLDDGWFSGRRHDKAGLGDWFVDPQIFPAGLHPLCNHVRALGMEFGLWVEPEMLNPDSDLYRAHPDWSLHLPDRQSLTARHQLVLDLANPAAFAYVEARLVALLKEYPIAYLKWDHNRDLTAVGHGGRAPFRNQTSHAYQLLANIRQQFPDVEIEACAGGGGRIDAGILAHTHRFWLSDCIDALSRLSIQSGFLQFFPPELMGSHVGASP